MNARTLTLAGLAAAAVLVTACGDQERPVTARQPSAPRLTKGQKVRDKLAGTFPPRPQVLVDFSKGAAGGFPGTISGGALVFRAAAAARLEVEPGTRGTLLETAVHPPKRGFVGAFCRGSEDAGSGYALLIDRDGRVRLERRDAEEIKVLRRFSLSHSERSDDGEPTLLRLACGAGTPGTPATIAFTINASPYAYVADLKSLPAGATSSVGLLATGGAARADHAAIWLSE